MTLSQRKDDLFRRIKVPLSRALQDLTREFREAQRDKAWSALDRFVEYADRVDRRFEELSEAQDHTSAMVVPPGPELDEAQRHLVDKTEAFHQEIYAALSAFIILLNHVSPRSVRGQLPRRSVQKFLEFVEQNYADVVGRETTTQLLASVRLRARFIDHPQQGPVHDWMTMRSDDRTVVIYYIPIAIPTTVRMVAVHDPFAPDFRPPVDCAEFCVAPWPEYTCRAFEKLVILLPRSLADDVASP